MEDRIKGLDFGADLYFAKPVDLRELAAGIGSLHRRLGAAGPGAGAWTSCNRRLHTPGGAEVALTDLELQVPGPLLDRPGEGVDREELLLALEQRSRPLRHAPAGDHAQPPAEQGAPAQPRRSPSGRARHGKGYAFLSDATPG